MNIATVGNLLEAGLWFAVAAALLATLPRGNLARRHRWVLALTFVVFGVSDLIEMRTGAWWKPAWLLVVKAACVISIGYGIWQMVRERNLPSSPEAAVDEPETDEPVKADE